MRGTESQKEDQSSLKDPLVKTIESKQPSCLFLDSRITLQGETPAIEKPLGLYLDSKSTLQAEKVEMNEMNKKIKEFQREIDDERTLKETEIGKNKELVKQIEDIQRTNEIFLVVINCNNEIAKQNNEERAAKDKEEMQKSEEKIGVLLKENAAL
ncbi:hypothetical protein RHMOL_Rhmol05G0115800 [Rhododendron molle]|uniref:Uncharacterized protein n=1 Tax=Rhododendron molle TaxID=49168 RepID=A0ACC0NN35_RHOML|nr:hypothetical protein RHMOL_Rhmol05G0115800 [Rhododendron molle]